LNATSQAVFISYASQDAEAAGRISEALRAAGIEVWFDQSELRGGDAWDQKIRREIRDCALFIPVISANTVARAEGYFRLEWSVAEQRSHMVARNKPFIVPVCLDRTPESVADVPESFQRVQWTRLLDGNTPPAFPARIVALLGASGAVASVADSTHSSATTRLVAPLVLAPAATVKSTLRKNRVAIALMATIIVILACVAVDKLWISKHVSRETPAATASPVASAGITALPAISEKSIAVLPFVDMSQKKDQEYFSDGLSEELIDRLAHSPNLKVIARTSSFQFKGSKDDVRTIGQKLGVASLLEGSVRTSGKKLRVTAQLINASDGSHVWSETYDRDIGDVFKVQDSIAEAVVTALKAAIAVPTASVPYKPESTDAYNAYLRGNYFYRKDTKQGTEQALASFEEASRLDSRYADAWVGIANVHNLRGLELWTPPKEAYAEARKAIDHALSIDPNSAAAYVALGHIEGNFTFDEEKSRAAFKRARELDPAVDTGNAGVWEALSAGRIDDAIALSRQLVQRDPLIGGRLEDLATALWMANRLPEAQRTLRHLLELNSSYAWGHCLLGWVLLEARKPDAALAIMRQEADRDSQWCVADALWALGRRTEADAFLAEAKAKYADTQAYQITQSYALRGDKDEAFKWLNRAYDNREFLLCVVRQNPMLRNLRDDPRFTELVRKLKLPD
jgi:TolB-like protein